MLIDAGVRTFVDLTTSDDGLAPYATVVADVAKARELDLRHEPFPIPDLAVVADDGYDDVLATIAWATVSGAVYVHCWGGVGRTGTVVGCHLVDQGLSHDEVLTRLTDLRTATRKATHPAPETPARQDVIPRRAGRSA